MTEGFSLTSTVIKARQNGEYPFDEEDFLLPHEALRAELSRMERAIYCLDSSVKSNPYQIRAIKKWTDEFFFKVVKIHHVTEDDVVTPHLQSLGEATPPSIHKEHEDLLVLMDRVNAAILSLSNAVHKKDEVEIEVTALKDIMKKFSSSFLQHLSEEEEYYPPTLKKLGEKNAIDMRKKIQDHINQNMDSTTSSMLISILLAMGLPRVIEYINKHSVKGAVTVSGGWASKKHYKPLYKGLPWFVRIFIFPSFMKEYQRYKNMIDSVPLKLNVLKL
jgi:hemerythrin superfamily protein